MGIEVWLDVSAEIAAICTAMAMIATTALVWRKMRLQSQGRATDERKVLRDCRRSAWYRDRDRLEDFVGGLLLMANNGSLFAETEQMVTGWQQMEKIG
ncbi:MAG: hypothetical protein AAF408_12070 [Pseudomonadota bacterium]